MLQSIYFKASAILGFAWALRSRQVAYTPRARALLTEVTPSCGLGFRV